MSEWPTVWATSSIGAPFLSALVMKVARSAWGVTLSRIIL